MLFLGTSEGIGEFDALFGALDRKAKLYKRKDDFHGMQRTALGRFQPSMTVADAAAWRGTAKVSFPAKLPLRELAEQALLQQVVSAGVLVNAQGDILYLHGRTGMYLEPAPGEAGVNNILKMAREGLRHDLTTALHKAVGLKEIVRYPGLWVKTNGHFTLVNLTIRPVAISSAATSESLLYLVVLEEAPLQPVPGSADEHATNEPSLNSQQVRPAVLSVGADIDAGILALKQELRAKDEYIQSTHEELESSNEELKSSNEEMQSVNEELQSTNEELETSKEELQSVNEELATVNTELQIKVSDLSRANNDMNNLLAGTGIGTVFVDHQLHILRFTPAVREIINLILSDIGRPVAHIVSNLVGYNNLVEDVRAVLNTLVPKEIEVQTKLGKWYAMRIQPYRTLDNVIEGAVISFVDITEMKRTQEALHEVNEQLRFAAVARDAFDAVSMQDMDGHILLWNSGAVRMYGWSEAEALQMNVRERIPQQLREGALDKLVQLSQLKTLEPHHTQRLNKQGVVVGVSIVATALVNEAGKVYAIATTERVQEVL